MIEPVARLRIELQEIEPKVWRRVDVPLSSTLLALHDVIQVTFGWTNSHLFEFEVGDRVYGDPMLDEDLYDQRVYKARSIRLKSLVERGVERFLYLYDFGDSWTHDISIESVRDGDADVEYPAFVGGERRGPPEDCGGVVGFMEFLEAALNPLHEEHHATVRWYGKPFDPLEIDEERIRLVLSSMAARRLGPLKSHRGGARRRST